MKDHVRTTQSFQLILCALLVALLCGTQVVAMFMCDHAWTASRSSARRSRERRMRSALRHERLSIAKHLGRDEKVVESGDEVEVTKGCAAF